MTAPRPQLQHSAPSSPAHPIEADGLTEFVTLPRGAQRGPDAERCREEARTVPPRPPTRKSARTPPPRLFASLSSRSAMAWGAQRAPDAERYREEARTVPPKPPTPPARKIACTSPQRLFASISRSALTSPSCWAAEPREQPSAHERQNLTIMRGDSVLSAAATDCEGGSPTTTLSLELGELGAGRYDQDPIVSRAHGAPGGNDARRGEGSTPPGTPITPAHMPW